MRPTPVEARPEPSSPLGPVANLSSRRQVQFSKQIELCRLRLSGQVWGPARSGATAHFSHCINADCTCPVKFGAVRYLGVTAHFSQLNWYRLRLSRQVSGPAQFSATAHFSRWLIPSFETSDRPHNQGAGLCESALLVKPGCACRNVDGQVQSKAAVAML